MLLTLLLALTPCPVQDDPLAESRDAYHAHYEADATVQLETLWAARPELVMVLLEDDLAKTRAAWGLGPTPAQVLRIKAIEARALWGARIAAETLDRPAIADYTASVIGWNADERAAWRARQDQQAAALEHFRAGRFADAASAARKSRAAAAAAGDWWSEAGGWTLEGMALEAAGDKPGALVAVVRARLLNHELGLIGAEYQNLRGMVSLLTQLEQWSRAREAARSAAVLARTLGDRAGLRIVLRERLELEERMGDRKALRDVRKQLDDLQD